MAADKTTKTKSQKKTVVKKTELPKTLPELQKVLDEKQNDLLEARKGHRAGELVNPRTITLTRKEIARVKTAMRAKELKGEE